MQKDAHKFVANPLNAYLLIKHLSYDVQSAQSIVTNTINKFESNLKHTKLSMIDFSGAVTAFIRLQKTYELQSEDLIMGYIDGKKYRDELSVDDIFALGKEMKKIDSDYAENYLDLALSKNRQLSHQIDEKEILYEIFQLLNETSNIEKAVKVLDEILKLDPGNVDLEEKKIDLDLRMVFPDDKLSKVEDEQDTSGTFHATRKEFEVFSKSCIGRNVQNVSVISKLFCHYQSNNAFTKIAPFKVEVANLLPYVAIFHEVISDYEIEIFKTTSMIRLHRAEILSPNSTTQVSSSRVAKLCWHTDYGHKVMQTLSRRVG